MSGVLCIDFGTSSIRAMCRMLNSYVTKALAIGRVTKSQLDDYSIPSDIHIDNQKGHVSYGEHAIIASKKSPHSLLYESSPKLWLKEPWLLGEPAAEGVSIAREELLVGLLANALRACFDVMGNQEETFRSNEVRISTPVWPSDIAEEAEAAIDRISARAQQIVFGRKKWSKISVESLKKLTKTCQSVSASDAEKRGSLKKVVEPIAAAVTMWYPMQNSRRVCAVIDVGAGTTDIGLFVSVEPDIDAKKEVLRKLLPQGEPISVFKAGNAIDDIVLSLLKKKAPKASPTELADVKARIRRVKEILFKNKIIQELSVALELKEVRNDAAAKSMAKEIRTHLENLIIKNKKNISDLVLVSNSSAKLEIVMAGGGGLIDFIRDAVSQPFTLDNQKLPVDIQYDAAYENTNYFGAGLMRMAVAFGGASSEYDKLDSEMKTATRYPGLRPQKISQ
jgi:hypothetical protein